MNQEDQDIQENTQEEADIHELRYKITTTLNSLQKESKLLPFLEQVWAVAAASLTINPDIMIDYIEANRKFFREKKSRFLEDPTDDRMEKIVTSVEAILSSWDTFHEDYQKEKETIHGD